MRSKFFFIVMFFALLIGCEKKSPPLVLLEIGPNSTKINQAFNIQRDGSAAMWAKTQNATKSTALVWEDKKLLTSYKNPEFLTVSVPRELYAEAGTFSLFLFDSQTERKSNILIFTVEK